METIEEQICPICITDLTENRCWYPCCQRHFLHIECYLKSALIYKSQCPIDRRFIRYVKYAKDLDDIQHNVYLSAGHMSCSEKLFYFWQQVSTNRIYKGLFAHFWSTKNFLPFAISLKRKNVKSQNPRYVTFLDILVRDRGDVKILKDGIINNSTATYVICLETYVTEDFINYKDLFIETKFNVETSPLRYSFHISMFREIHRESLDYFVSNEIQKLAI